LEKDLDINNIYQKKKKIEPKTQQPTEVKKTSSFSDFFSNLFQKKEVKKEVKIEEKKEVKEEPTFSLDSVKINLKSENLININENEVEDLYEPILVFKIENDLKSK
jgi:hypothetical protein